MKKINNEFDVIIQKEKPKQKFKPLPVEKPINTKSKKINKEKSGKFKWVALISIIILVSWGLSLVQEGYFKDEVNQDVNVEPEIKITPNYNFTIETENLYNQSITIINQIYLNNTG